MQYTLPHLIAHQCEKQSDSIAIRPVEGPPCSWADLDLQARSWSGALESAGVNAGDTVLTMLLAGIDGALGWVGPAYRGAIEVAVNHAFRGDWLEWIITNTKARVAVIDWRFWAQWESLEGLHELETLVVANGPAELPPTRPGQRVVPLPEFLADCGKASGPHRGQQCDIASIIYTSGTTGRSKGVLQPWRQWQGYVEAEVVPHDVRGNCEYAPYNPCHISGKLPFYSAAYLGTSVCTRAGFKTDEWLSDIRTYGCTYTTLVGAMANFVHHMPRLPDDAANPLTSVSMAPVLPDIDDFKERFGVKVFTVYSMTEIRIACASKTHYEVTGENHTSCGRAHRPEDIRLVDEFGSEVPPGVPGELIIRGEPWELNAGYLDMPLESLEVRRDGWFHTGDVLRRDEDGLYYFVDRLKDMMRRRGENISSFEVESAVLSHPAVRYAAAYGVPSDSGSEEEVMVAVELQPDAALEPAELLAYLKPKMPSFAVPRYIEVRAEMPMTLTERIRKFELRQAGVSAATWDALEPGNGL